MYYTESDFGTGDFAAHAGESIIIVRFVMDSMMKKRGRPRKYDIIEVEEEKIVVGDETYVAKHRKVSRVDSDYVVRHLLSYFTRVAVIHQEMAKQKGLMQPVFERLKNLDGQMTEICQKLLSSL